MATGSVQHRGKSWRARVITDVDPATGKRKVASKTFRLKKEADAWVTSTLDDLRTGEYVEPSRERLGDYLDAWLARHDCRPSSRARYEIAIRCHITPALGSVQLGKLQPRQLQALYDQLTPSTAVVVRAVLRQAFDQAVREGRLARNPSQGLRLPARPARSEPTLWTPVELARFLEAAAETRYGRVFWLLAATGLRVGEALALRWADLDLEQGTLRVAQGRTLDAEKRSAIGEPKAEASKRRIALDATTVTVLQEQRAAVAAARAILGPDWQDAGLVFTREDGRLVHPRTIQHAMDRILADLPELPRLTPHGLRHLYASNLAAHGVPLSVIQRTLGHSSYTTTAGFYLHLVPDAERQTAEVFAALMDAARAERRGPAAVAGPDGGQARPA